MLNILIVLSIVVGLVAHRYLSTFWENHALPYPGGFLIFSNLFVVVYSIGLIWMFGIFSGLLLAAGCFFQLVYSSVLWIFSIPWVLKINKATTLPRVNWMVLGGFSYLVIFLSCLVLINFFSSSYGMLDNLERNDLLAFWRYFALFAILGNIARYFAIEILVNKK